MRPRYLPSTANQRDRWMVSYVDVLTIVLIFFLVAAARGLVAPAVHAVVPSPPPETSAAPPVPAKPTAAPEPETPRTNLIQAQKRLSDQGLAAELEARGLVVSLPQVVLFSPGDDTVSTRALPSIARIAEVLGDIPNQVQLVGHADTVPIHNRRFRSNWDLSMARSQKILQLLSRRYGISESRLSIASYGPYRPAAPNDTVDGRASNRRVEIVILDESPVETAQVEMSIAKDLASVK
jgi:chemotaxis protein MotB